MFEIGLKVAPGKCKFKNEIVIFLLDIGKINRNLESQNKPQLYVGLLSCSWLLFLFPFLPQHTHTGKKEIVVHWVTPLHDAIGNPS